LGITGIDVTTAHNFCDKAQMRGDGPDADERTEDRDQDEQVIGVEGVM
jgi:hypothetical protein